MKDFNQIYKELYEKSYEELESLRKGRIIRMIAILFITIIGLIILISTMEKVLFSEKGIGEVLIFFEVFAIMFLIFKLTMSVASKKEYVDTFKEKIIKQLVKNIDENLEYFPKRKLSASLYIKGDFEKFDIFSSEDVIEGILDNKYKIEVAEVYTQKKEETYEKTRKFPVFCGIFSNIECKKNINGKIKIYSRTSIMDNVFKEKANIEMDSTEFEKYFDIYSENRMLAMQILTADVMQTIIDFRKKYSIMYDLTIQENQLYIRLHTGKVFETSLFRKCLDLDTTKKYYDVLEFIFNLTRAINKAIEETEI